MMNITEQPSELEFPKFILNDENYLLILSIISILLAVGLQNGKPQPFEDLGSVRPNSISEYLKLLLEGPLNLQDLTDPLN